jgi:hypothetical protein
MDDKYGTAYSTYSIQYIQKGYKILIVQSEVNRLLGIQMRKWKNDTERFINIVCGLRIRFFDSK